MTPFQKSALTTKPLVYYNWIQSKARRCVEQAFGILKKVFRLLDMRSEESIELKIKATWSCLLLHNMLIRYRQGLAEADGPFSEYAILRDEHMRLVAQVANDPAIRRFPNPALGRSGAVHASAMASNSDSDDAAPGEADSVDSDGGDSDSESTGRAGAGGPGPAQRSERPPTLKRKRELAVARRQEVVDQLWEARKRAARPQSMDV